MATAWRSLVAATSLAGSRDEAADSTGPIGALKPRRLSPVTGKSNNHQSSLRSGSQPSRLDARAKELQRAADDIRSMKAISFPPDSVIPDWPTTHWFHRRRTGSG
jgi:hypothetical protein